MAAEEVIFRIIVQAEQARKSLEDIKSGFMGLGDVAKDIFGANIFGGFIDGLRKAGESAIEFATDSVRVFANFEQIMTTAARTAGLTAEETKALSEELLNLANGAMQGGMAVEELGRIAGIAGQLGVPKEQIAEFTMTIAQMSTAFEMSAEAAAAGMATLSNVYGLTSQEMRSLGDGITELANSTNATAADIINISQRMGAVAEFMGLSAGQVAAIAATMRDLGVTSEVAGTSMSQILARIMGDYQKYAEVLKIDSQQLREALESNDPSQALFMVLNALNQINAQGGKIEAIQALSDLGLTGVRVQNSLLLLSGAVNDLRANIELEKEAELAGQAITDSYSTAIQTSTGRWNEFQEAIKQVQMIIGGPLAEAFSTFLQRWLTPIVEEFAAWLDQSEAFDQFFSVLLPDVLDKVGFIIKDLSRDFFDFLHAFDETGADGVNAFGDVIMALLKDLQVEIVATTGELKAWWNEHWPKIKEGALEFLKIIENLPDTIQLIADTLDMWIADFNAGIEWAEGGLKKIYDLALKLKEVWSIVDAVSSKLPGTIAAKMAGESLLNFVMGTQSATEGINDMTAATEHFADVAYVNSVFPDTVLWLDKTKGGIDSASGSIDAMGGHMQGIYQTGQGVFTNLRKEVDSTMQIWQRSDEKVQAGQSKNQFSLYQTADAVMYAGKVFESTAQVAKDAFVATGEVIADVFANAVKLENTALESVQKVMDATAASLQKVASAGGFSSSDLQAMLKSPGLMTASSMIQSRQAIRAEGWQNLPTISQMQAAQTPASAPNVIFQGTNIVDERSVDAFARKVTESQKQQQSRITR